MRRLITYAVEHRIITYFMCFILVVGGLVSFFSLGQLEDPVFSVKSATIFTRYPGASPEEVEQEVTDKLEKAVQEMTEVKNISSTSRAGESYIKVDIKSQYWADKLPQIWDELRKKISDAAEQLPPGANTPRVMDDFGFVYGFLLALTGDGFSYRELEDYAEALRKELNLVNGVSRVGLWGVQRKAIYLDVSEMQLSQLNLSPTTILSTLQDQNLVVDAGGIDIKSGRIRMAPTGAFKNPLDIGELLIRSQATDVVDNLINREDEESASPEVVDSVLQEAGSSILRVKDIAEVRRGYLDPPISIMRYNGKPAIAIQIAGSDDSNIVEVGAALDARIAEITEILPIGLNINKIAWQSDLVSEAVNGFLINLVQAVIIVLLVLIIPSGLRVGLIVGIDLVLTILATFIVMAIMEIPLQRMSLGALIIALGMMVDNSIVVADGIVVKIREGFDRKSAAIAAATSPAFPLLAATLIAVMAFYPIYASTEDAGEYCRTLFIVVGTSLTISWLVAMLITPLQCLDMLPETTPDETDGDAFDKPFFRCFRQTLRWLIARRFLAMAACVGLLTLSLIGFGFVKQMFFPDSSRPQMMVDYWAPAGTRIQQVSADLGQIEENLVNDPSVISVSSFIGAGPPRFYLPVDPEKNYSNYAQLIINFRSFEDVDPFIEKYENKIIEKTSQAMIRFRKYGVGPSNTWPFEVRFSGPANAHLATLRNLGDEALAIAKQSPDGRDWRLNMQNRTLKLEPIYDQKRGRWSSISRADLASALKRSYDGRIVGQYREGDHLYPIIVRNTEQERQTFASNIELQQAQGELSTQAVPIGQVVDGLPVVWEDPFIFRWDRRRSVTLQGAPVPGVTFPTLKASIGKEIEAMPLPPGYTLSWDGEENSTKKAQESLIPGVIPAVVMVLILLILVFNAFRPILIILLTIPFALIGITLGLLLFDIPFGFLALLGGMSLAGMMNKNIVVLLDACNENIAEGMDRYNAIIEASVTRVRPVLLAAGTTVLGVIPLLQDIFWVAMAVTIMAGLAFGSLLTLFVVPLLYSIFYRLRGADE